MLKINTPAELQTGVFFGAERINAFPTTVSQIYQNQLSKFVQPAYFLWNGKLL